MKQNDDLVAKSVQSSEVSFLFIWHCLLATQVAHSTSGHPGAAACHDREAGGSVLEKDAIIAQKDVASAGQKATIEDLTSAISKHHTVEDQTKVTVCTLDLALASA